MNNDFFSKLFNKINNMSGKETETNNYDAIDDSFIDDVFFDEKIAEVDKSYHAAC